MYPINPFSILHVIDIFRLRDWGRSVLPESCASLVSLRCCICGRHFQTARHLNCRLWIRVCTTDVLLHIQISCLFFFPLVIRCAWRRLPFCPVSSVLQRLDDSLCRGLKHLLLGAIHKCLGNMRDALQVPVCRPDWHGAAVRCHTVKKLLLCLTSSRSSWLLEMSMDGRSIPTFSRMLSMNWDVYYLHNQRSVFFLYTLFVDIW